MLKPILQVIAIVLILCVVLVVPAHSQDNTLSTISGANLATGTLLTLETFDLADAWEQYSNPMGVELGVENGVYRAYTMNGSDGHCTFAGNAIFPKKTSCSQLVGQLLAVAWSAFRQSNQSL